MRQLLARRQKRSASIYPHEKPWLSNPPKCYQCMHKKGIIRPRSSFSLHVISWPMPRTNVSFSLYKGTFSIMPTAPSLPTVKMMSPSVLVAKPASQ
jgi:hypothetical protein